MALSDNIKTRRTQLKMSQEYVADQLGISRQAVAKWESGKSRPTAANLAELAALFEMSVSELVDPEKEKEEQRIREEKAEEQLKERQRNAKMLVGRWLTVASVNGGWDGYSSGLYSSNKLYWIAITLIGIVLLYITSKDMNKRHKVEKMQMAVGAVMIFSIFFLPGIIPVENTGLRYFLADVVTGICIVILNLKYWRYIWKVK